MSNEKQTLVAAYQDLSAALLKTSLAVSDFNKKLAGVSPNDLPAFMEGVPANVPYFAAVVPAGGDASDEVNGKKGKKEKKEKKIKDPNAPKRPPSAYLEFQNSVRTKFREEAPELSYQDVLRKISAVWLAMPEEEKKLYQDITVEKTATYDQAKTAYDVEHGIAPTAAKGGDADTTDISVDGTPSKVGKDGKEYTGKKRGRKSNAEKQKEADDAAANGVVDPALTDPAQVQAIARAVVGDAKKEKKDKKKAAVVVPAVAAKPAKTPKSPTKVAPVVEKAASDSSESDSDDSDASEDSDDSDEEEEVPAPKPSSSKDKRKVEANVEKPKHKKSKTAAA
ncbi:hypothetical protein P7C70_g79, partial [Phenoliferia sp. Uapishka_3]